MTGIINFGKLHSECALHLFPKGSSQAGNNPMMNGAMLGQNSAFGNPYQAPQTYETDEELVERFRMEAKLEIERERQKAVERQLLMSRQPPPPVCQD